MTYDQFVNLYFDRSNALQWYWTLYVVIIGGLLAFSSLRQRGDLLTTLLICILFSFFAYKNMGAIHDTTLQRMAVLQSIKDSPFSLATDAKQISQRQAFEATLVAPEWEGPLGTRNFHVTCDGLTIITLLAMELRRRRAAPAPAA
jgi:hypothetical protein